MKTGYSSIQNFSVTDIQENQDFHFGHNQKIHWYQILFLRISAPLKLL